MNIDPEKFAAALRMFADSIDGGESTEPTPKKGKTKTSANHILSPEKTAETREVTPLQAKNGDETNVYQILLAHVGTVNKPFDVFEMIKHRDNNPFKGAPPLPRVMLELKLLEAEKLAVPIDDLRQKWILLKA